MLLGFALTCALLVPSALPSVAASPSAGPSAPPDDGASIVNSGSTNLAGYQLHVLPNGSVVAGPGASAPKQVSAALARRLFADLAAAGPLDRLPAAACMKSASFGSVTRVTYRGQTSPDLSCPSSSRALRALAADAAAVTDAAGIRPTTRSRLVLP
ncbi:MAG: hypothetical protein WAJ85_09985 [Candidatus Baltobacteraceae bacterium]